MATLSEGTSAGAEAVLKEIEDAFGMVPNLFRAYAAHPPLLKANWEKVKAVMMEGALSRKVKEAMAFLVSKDNSCDYCVTAHGAALRSIGVSEEEMKVIEEDPGSAPFDEKEKALIEFIRKANLEPLAVSETELDRVRAAGATEADIVEALGVMELFIAFNRFADTMKIEVDF